MVRLRWDTTQSHILHVAAPSLAILNSTIDQQENKHVVYIKVFDIQQRKYIFVWHGRSQTSSKRDGLSAEKERSAGDISIKNSADIYSPEADLKEEAREPSEMRGALTCNNTLSLSGWLELLSRWRRAHHGYLQLRRWLHRVCVFVCVCARECVFVCVCAWVCVFVCARALENACVTVTFPYDQEGNNIFRGQAIRILFIYLNTRDTASFSALLQHLVFTKLCSLISNCTMAQWVSENV